jgi:HK97 family phage prohead protease
MATPNNIERRGLNLAVAELRVSTRDDGKPVIEGYAAKFNTMSEDLGGFRETIHPAAFNNCIGRCDVRALKNHDPNYLLGRTKNGTLELKADETGLHFRCVMGRSSVHQDVLESIARGDMDGCSFSFTTDEPNGDDWDDSTSPPLV